jgi:hypothetical protein
LAVWGASHASSRDNQSLDGTASERMSSTAKNKLQKPVLFFFAQKHAASRPRLPRIPPQIHHKNTTAKPPFSQKTPVKTTNPPRQKKEAVFCKFVRWKKGKTRLSDQNSTGKVRCS